MVLSEQFVGTVSNIVREVCFTVEVIDDEIVEEPQETLNVVLTIEVRVETS